MDSVLDLSGILYDDIILYNKILDAYYVKMNEVTVSSLISCNIRIQDITLKNSNNCIINIVNRCFTNSFISLNVLIETIIESLEFISDDIRNRIEKKLGIVLKLGEDQSKSHLMQRCNISSEVTNSINVQRLVIQNCNSQKPLNFDFYNTGDAKANCGIVELLQALSDKDGEKEENLNNKFDFILNKVFNLNLTDYLYIIGLIIFVLIVVLIVSNLTSSKKVVFKFNTILKKN
ncbi:putative S-S bond formation pathway protein substrate [Yalta virus]|nr:putative S-S bond formation pathway protein substrate [Yalta virus]